MSNKDYELAQRILPLIDLTDLSDSCTEQSIESLYSQSQTSFGSVASLCIWPRFVSYARKLSDDFPLACVINFPNGEDSQEKVIEDVKTALNAGATEIDLVHDYRTFISGDESKLVSLVESVKAEMAHHQGTLLKVILETGVLNDSSLIKRASELSILSHADFIKTSTGKVSVNATLESAECMLRAISQSKNPVGKTPVGFKAAGGIKTITDAQDYITLAEKIMGSDYITPRTFRFGASSLLTDVLSTLSGESSPATSTTY